MMTRRAIGSELPPVVVALTPERVRAFTALAGDRNATHYDDATARAQGFAGALVHGAVTISVILRTLTGDGTHRFAADDDLALTFLVPVAPGDTLTGRARVTETADAHTTYDVWCENQYRVRVLAGTARTRDTR